MSADKLYTIVAVPTGPEAEDLRNWVLYQSDNLDQTREVYNELRELDFSSLDPTTERPDEQALVLLDPDDTVIYACS